MSKDDYTQMVEGVDSLFQKLLGDGDDSAIQEILIDGKCSGFEY